MHAFSGRHDSYSVARDGVGRIRPPWSCKTSFQVLRERGETTRREDEYRP
jgi:hypothetical protein